MAKKWSLRWFGHWIWQGFNIYQFLAWLGSTGVINFIVHSVSNTVQASSLVWQVVLYASIGALVFVPIRIVWPYLWLKVKGTGKHLPQPEIHAMPQDGLYEVYQQLVAWDRYHLKEALIVQNVRLSHYEFNQIRGGQVQFEFDVFNGSILPVDVGKVVEGDLTANQRGFHDKIESLETALIYHVHWGKVSIKQRILPEVCKEINKEANKPDGFILSFNFEKVQVRIDEHDSTIPNNPQNLNLPKQLNLRIKLTELKSGDAIFGDYRIIPVSDTNVTQGRF